MFPTSRWLLLCALVLSLPRAARGDIVETLSTPEGGTPSQTGLATAVFHGTNAPNFDNPAQVLTDVQSLSALPYYAFQDTGVNTRMAGSNEINYYPSNGTTESFFLGDATGVAASDAAQWQHSGVDFVGYIYFPVVGNYNVNIVGANDFMAVFVNGNGTPGSGDFIAAQNYYGSFSGQAGISNSAQLQVTTSGWYPFEMANMQGYGGAGMDITIIGPAPVQFGSDFNHWTAFVPAIPLNITPVPSYSAPQGLAAAVWHNVPSLGGDITSVPNLVAYANSTQPNYVFLDAAADTNFFGYAQLNYGTGEYTVRGFVNIGAAGLARDDTYTFDNTMIDFVGWMQVPVDGIYYITMEGDDSAMLLFGGTGPVGSGIEWIRTDYNGNSNSFNPMISSLKAGWYPIEILYYQVNGGDELVVTYTGPGEIHLAADANRWNGSVSGLSVANPSPPPSTSRVSGLAASVYHLSNSYASGMPLDATLLPTLQATINSTLPNYRYFSRPFGNPNGLYYRGNEAQATSGVLGAYGQGSGASDATPIGSTLIDHQGYIYFGAAGYQWILLDAATDFGAVYLGGTGQSGSGQLLFAGSFNDAPGAGAWARVNAAQPGWYPIEVMYLSRYDCGASCNANLILSAWGPGSIDYTSALVSSAAPPATSGLLATVYRLNKPLPIGTDVYNIARQLPQVGALQPNYTFLDPAGAASFNLSGTDTTPLNTFLGAHANGLASADSNVLGATLIDFRGDVVFSQAGNYTIALTAADDAAVLMLGQEPNIPGGQIILERNYNGAVSSAYGLNSPLTLQVTTPTSHPFELVYYNSADPNSTHSAALGLSITGPGPVSFAAPHNAPPHVRQCGNFNAWVPYTTSVVDVANYGAIPNDGVDDYLGIQQAVAALSSYQTLRFHAGNYNIAYSELGSIASLVNLSNIEIDGQGANFIISGYNIDQPATVSALFNMVGCDHVTVHDLTIDMTRPPFSFGYVTAELASSGLRVQFDPAPSVDAGMTIAAITEYDVNGLPLAAGLNDYYLDNTSLYSVYQNSPQLLQISMTGRTTPGAQTGEYVMVRHAFREQPAFSVLNSNAIAMGNVNVWAAPGDGVQANMVNGMYIQNLNIRKTAGRRMSVTGHGIEAHGTTGGITICGSTLEGMGGDGIVTAGQPGLVTAVSGQSVTVNTNASFGVAPFRVGDSVRVFSPNGISRGGGILTPSSSISDTRTTNTLAFAFIPSGTQVGDAVVAYNRDTNINVRYSSIVRNSGRGIALANGRVVIDHTQIQGTTGYGVQCFADLQNTAPACDRVLLTNNSFNAVGLSASLAATSFVSYCNNAVCPHQLTKSITLIGNAFDNTAGRAAEFASVYGFSMMNNALNQIAPTQPLNSTSAVDIQQSTLGVITGNSVWNSSVLAVTQAGDTNVVVGGNSGTW